MASSVKKIAILGKPWEEILLEMIIVILSIMIAFFLDNWWSGVQDRNETLETLQAVVREFETNNTLLDKHIGFTGHNQACAAQLLLLDPDGIRNFPPRLIDSLLYFSLINPKFEPDVGVTEDIISSGKLKVLDNAELEQEISDWLSVINLKDKLEREAADRIESFTLKYLYENISFLKLDKQFSPQMELLAGARTDDHNYLIFGQKSFRSFLDDQVFHYGQYQKLLQRLLDINQNVLSMSKKELSV